jgi:hypothetical protein
MGVNFSGKRLGWVGTKIDPKVPMLMSLVQNPAEMPPPPADQDWYSDVASWPMDNNDTEPDCTAAGVAHAIQQWTAYAQSMCIIMEANAVLDFYKLTQAPGGEGAYLIDVLTYWMSTGVDTKTLAGVHKIDAFARLDRGDANDARCAIAWFGNTLIGLLLPLSAQTQDVWEMTSGPAAVAGSWGGHCVLCVGYDADWVYFVSWGKLMKMSWAFYEKYADEAYVIMTESFMKPPGVTPGGLDWATLQQRMRVLKAANS